MKYLCLCYYDVKKFEALSKAWLEALASECKPHDEALRKSGKVVVHGSLSIPQLWKSVRPENGKPLITDGPYAEAKEQVGAFFIIEAKDMDEAMQVASKHPSAHLSIGKLLGGGIEVRTCDMFEQP